VVLIPDLARISLAGARAAVEQVGAEVAVLERDGESALWRPSLAWVARLARVEVGELSPHLLDRFALRVTVPAGAAADRVAEILAGAEPSGPSSVAEPSLPLDLLARLEALPTRLPYAASALLCRVLTFFPARETPGSRRPLALVRFARALAWLDGDSEVFPGHVAEAARLVGLADPAHVAPASPPAATPESLPQETPAEPAPATMPASFAAPVPVKAPVAEAGPATLGQEPVLPDPEQVFPVALLPPPYPEDTEPPAREAYPLQIPPLHDRNPAGSGGVPIGTRRAHDLRDLAVVSTVLQAAKFQRVRPSRPSGGGFRVTPADLRAYRRIPVPRQVLGLVLDYTALADCRWQEALLPHLTWAYVSRASVCLVQVGARGAPEPLRAEQFTARNLLSPRVRAALEAAPGTATPLAHGLELAARALRRAFQQGRSHIRSGILVVVTDGRGNVPLEASLTGVLEGRVMRQGVDDAIRAARPLATFNELTRVLLHPNPQQYPHLPLELAEAMGARAEAMELLDSAAES
jgi:magnesium chelatase subunit D